MDNKKESLTREERLIMLIDKYITATYDTEDEIFTYKLFLIFVGYHLKYFHYHATHSDSLSNIDNIMQMFCSVFRCMKSNFIKKLQNKEFIFVQLNALVDYIGSNQIKLEQVYVELKAQYEKREITNRIKNKSDTRKRVRL
ncbi:TPA: hypothetical protein RXU73_002981 [Yersinia enterocolitica]|uniref:hypothetical protein n=1 Tax=Yersinia enterocolitica TaxID=630 RepID=UPI0028F1B096|nr:hypothetical protein [Yersinia enterocolitica]